ncbi:hypothetical protein H6P81_014338 [Aristolochia fimbriata]|uniref:WD repeat-containing protein 53 n=1 Tax=Aristolochia fimbriata TaxID=158543 RepID=A0AAV7EJD3_ARIFI|nr:hypothetical protein H6P81_014338 [Aristolochia fimbriata]
MSASGTMKPRRLKGHKSEITCCIASRDRPRVIVSCGEDGCICWFDLRCKDVILTMDVGKGPISSVCFKSGFEDVIYASSGTKVISFDVREASAWKPLDSYNYNNDEINQVTFRSKSSFLAAADDSGDVKIIDTNQQCLYKTLRAGHTNICSSVQFLPWRPWEVVTGGLDAKFVIWDFSRGRPLRVVDFGMPDTDRSKCNSDTSQCFNPPFVHAITVPDIDMLERSGKVCAVARGDGIVDVIDLDTEHALAKSKSSSHCKNTKRGSKSKNRQNLPNQGKRLQFDSAVGGHTAAVSSVAFSLFGERGRHIISGGNDALVKVWDLSKEASVEEDSRTPEFLQLSIDARKKINWLCTTPGDSENLIVCDTSKVLKVYTISQ